MADPFLLEAAGFTGRICLGLVFITAALGKLKHGRLFEGVIANYRILPRKAAGPGAWTSSAAPKANSAQGRSIAAGPAALRGRIR